MLAHSSRKDIQTDLILSQDLLFSTHASSWANLSISKLFKRFKVSLVDFLIRVFPVDKSLIPFDVSSLSNSVSFSSLDCFSRTFFSEACF